MNGYERALRTLNFESTDCTATWGGWISSADFFEYITGKPYWENPRAVAFEAYRKMEVDIVCQCLYLPESKAEWREITDETVSAQQRYKSAEKVAEYVRSLPNIETLEKEFDFDKHIDSLQSDYLRLQQELGSDIFCLPECSCARFIWYLDFGYQNYLEAIALYPDAMRKLFEYSAEEARLMNTVSAELVRKNILPPYFFMGQDICGSRGPIISPKLLRRLYLPCLRRSFEPLVEVGAEIIWHCDGYIIPVIDDLVSCGISGFQGFQEETGFDIADIAKRKVRGGRKPLLLAGLSVSKVVPFGTAADVEREVERIIDAVGCGCGLAVGLANTAGPDCPNENLEALYRHVHEYQPQ